MMEKQDAKVARVLKELKKADLKIVALGEYAYYYARQISNTRFANMPDFIVYCKTPSDVQICLKASTTHDYPFRIRSGGHQHEGMSSGNSVMIIDLSAMYDKKITYVAHDEAWIPVGKQLQEVYNELEKRGQIIPGGGCQSVNVGGLTQGGGWGTSIRKFGLTCANILEAEVVLADGRIIIASKDNECELFWSLRGGGGGNFGVVTRFKFKLSPLGRYTTSFAIRWTDKRVVPKVIKNWIDMQMIDFEGDESLDNNLSCTASLTIASAGDKNKECKAAVYANLGGMYYGTKESLLGLLKTHFGIENERWLLPLDENEIPIFENDPTDSKNWFVRLNQIENKTVTKKVPNLKSVARLVDPFSGRLTLEHQFIADFMNPTNIPSEITVATKSAINKKSSKKNIDEVVNCERDYHVLPNASGITCDQPHPHKITAGFPKQHTDHHALVDTIYKGLLNTKYYADVSKYMVWHCFGGAVLKNAEDNAFPFTDKPYLLQLQCWWDDSGHLNDDIGRNKEYVAWVNDFRKKYFAEQTDGAFINFIDKNIVSDNPDLNNIDERLRLLAYYYGENLDRLRACKKTYDTNNLFNFGMSIPPSE